MSVSRHVSLKGEWLVTKKTITREQRKMEQNHQKQKTGLITAKKYLVWGQTLQAVVWSVREVFSNGKAWATTLKDLINDYWSL
jgi:hypothetical protein